jgi:hypothetical protein
MTSFDAGGDDWREQLEEKAEFCLATGIQPSEYDAMTDDEREVFIETWNRIQRKLKG